MTELKFKSVTVTIPDGVEVTPSTLYAPRSGRRNDNRISVPDVLRAIEPSGFELVAVFDVNGPDPSILKRRARGGDPLSFSVATAAQDGAMLLIESDGLFRWAQPSVAPSARGLRTGPAAHNFELDFAAPGTTSTRARRGADDWTKKNIFGRAVVYVLKFVLRAGLQQVGDWIDGPGPFGLFRLTGDDPRQWMPDPDAPPTDIQKGPHKRILLFIHGTFSSTQTSFSNLATHNKPIFLDRMGNRYDDVFAFDHKTLGESVVDNAKALKKALAALDTQGETYVIDAIGYSRGGLVLRYLFEREMAGSSNFELGKMVMVGATLSGTDLANFDNWDDLLTLYSNVIAGATRLTGIVTGSQALTEPMTAIVMTMGNFARAVVETGIEIGTLPGLASMDPKGDIIKDIQRGPFLNDDQYHVIGSNFEPKAGQDVRLSERTKLFLADIAADQLFKANNDLVVDQASMASLSETVIIEGKRFDFSSDKAVYHTIYFAQSETAYQLQTWLLQDANKIQNDQEFLMLRRDIKDVSFSKRRSDYNPDGISAMLSPDLDNLEFLVESINDTFAASELEPIEVSAEPKNIILNVQAKCDSHLIVGNTAFIEAVLSRDKIDAIPSRVNQSGVGLVEEAGVVTVEIIPMSPHVRIAGEASQQIAVPSLMQGELRCIFEISPELPGEAKIFVRFSQGDVVFNSLFLHPTIATSGEQSVSNRVSIEHSNPEKGGVMLQIMESKADGDTYLTYSAICRDPSFNLHDSTKIKGSSPLTELFESKLNDIEAARIGKVPYKRLMDRLEGAGGALFRSLVPKELQILIQNHWDDITSIEVVTDQHIFPWELFYVPQKGFLAEKGLIRWRPNTPWGAAELPYYKNGFHFLCPTYDNPQNALPAARIEVDAIANLFGGGSELSTNYDDFVSYLGNPEGLSILHIACHGEASGGESLRAVLLLSDNNSDAIETSTVIGKINFENAPNTLVFLNACQVGRTGGAFKELGGFAESFLKPNIHEKGADVFIAPLWSVGDVTASTFAQSFYTELLGGARLIDAVGAARQKAKDNEDATWLSYSVYGNPRARLVRRD